MNASAQDELQRNLLGLTSDLKWSVVELKRIAERLSQAGNEADAQAVIRICQVMQAGEDRLAAYGHEVTTGLIVRSPKDE
ncbi:hypothetical protein [Pseudomonas donghuensis]|uniref:hypothetical protein n=1 Tax=Pseudomonas donghuensis TaxID=1163398 RepID=UPI00215DDBAA|nr:hypothetical protein [Pseudomonas donghuensis]UVL26788.1 hypothetical protein LOY30_12675 [Pseudomonas donghuensis]